MITVVLQVHPEPALDLDALSLNPHPALAIARGFSCAPGDAVANMELFIWSSPEYDSQNKRLPALGVAMPSPSIPACSSTQVRALCLIEWHTGNSRNASSSVWSTRGTSCFRSAVHSLLHDTPMLMRRKRGCLKGARVPTRTLVIKRAPYLSWYGALIEETDLVGLRAHRLVVAVSSYQKRCDHNSKDAKRGKNICPPA